MAACGIQQCFFWTLNFISEDKRRLAVSTLRPFRRVLVCQRLQCQNKTWFQWSKLPLGSLLIAIVLLLNLLAASPKLHEQFHADASKTHHHCAVTMFAHSQVDAADVAVVANVPSAVLEFLLPAPVSVSSIVAENLPPGRAPPLASCNS